MMAVEPPEPSLPLVWTGPRSLPGFEQITSLPPLPNDYGGVYLNTFPYEGGGFAPCGPGHTRRTFRKRWHQHVGAFRSGSYNILDIDEARHARRKQVWHGKKLTDELLHKLDCKRRSSANLPVNAPSSRVSMTTDWRSVRSSMTFSALA